MERTLYRHFPSSRIRNLAQDLRHFSFQRPLVESHLYYCRLFRIRQTNQFHYNGANEYLVQSMLHLAHHPSKAYHHMASLKCIQHILRNHPPYNTYKNKVSLLLSLIENDKTHITPPSNGYSY